MEVGWNKGSVWSGFLIGLAGWINLSVGGGILGAVLFAIGLLAVVWFGSSLYTGKAGSWEFRYYAVWRDIGRLGLVIVGNVIGCLIISQIAAASGTIKAETLSVILSSRESSTAMTTIARGIGCGFLMELAVWGWREKGSVLGIFLAVPGFILAGFYHSIADAFYYLVSPSSTYLIPWLLTVLGNFIGCNLRRFICYY
ncbi:MAG: formate/nitrite transporter family protein [Bacilli bacterium]|nr:formate/nitrite transporter family protein [Bacilli bacterium]